MTSIKQRNRPKKAKKPGKIDLVRLFESAAIELLAAVRRGQILHGTKNIRESGSPLESSFRQLLGTKLPNVYRVLAGYLVGINSECTPQIDAVVVSSVECHELMTSAEGASYTLFVGALAVCEVKNTTYNVAASLKQMSNILTSIASIASMRRAVRQYSNSGNELDEPLSIVLFGDSAECDLAAFAAWYASDEKRKLPTYTLLLDRGVIIASKSPLFTFDGDELGFAESKGPGELGLCVPVIQDEMVRGRALLWIYLAIADHLSGIGGRHGNFQVFTRSAERAYPVKWTGTLSSASSNVWPPAIK
ncbi:MAG: DUF6602 domain-containing protein [Steroidobacteraceae bacterium]